MWRALAFAALCHQAPAGHIEATLLVNLAVERRSQSYQERDDAVPARLVYERSVADSTNYDDDVLKLLPDMDALRVLDFQYDWHLNFELVGWSDNKLKRFGARSVHDLDYGLDPFFGPKCPQSGMRHGLESHSDSGRGPDERSGQAKMKRYVFVGDDAWSRQGPFQWKPRAVIGQIGLLGGNGGASGGLIRADGSERRYRAEDDSRSKSKEASATEPHLDLGIPGALTSGLRRAPLLTQIGIFAIYGVIAYGLVALGTFCFLAKKRKIGLSLIGAGTALIVSLVCVLISASP